MRRHFKIDAERQRRMEAGHIGTLNQIAVFWLIAKGTIPVAGTVRNGRGSDGRNDQKMPR